MKVSFMDQSSLNGITQKTKCVQRNCTKRNRVALMMVICLLSAVILVGCGQDPQEEAIPSVPMGTWVDSQKLAEKDGKLHPVTYRIESISRDAAEVQAAIDAYNLSAAGSMIGSLNNDKLEFCLANYSVNFPKDFPQSRFGITDVAIPFEIVSTTGGAIQVGDIIYQNLNTTWEIGERPRDNNFHSGDTYHGQIVFIMVKGYNDYLIHEIKEAASEAEEAYIKGE